jgi:hypothetical protein
MATKNVNECSSNKACLFLNGTSNYYATESNVYVGYVGPYTESRVSDGPCRSYFETKHCSACVLTAVTNVRNSEVEIEEMSVLHFGR